MKKIYLAALFLVLFSAVSLVALGAGGDVSDPVVSQSYLEQIWKDQFITPLIDETKTNLPNTYNDALRRACQAAAEANRTADKGNTALRRGFGQLVLKQGDVLRPDVGCKITLLSGTITADSTLVNVTLGKPSDTALAPHALYMQTDAASTGLTVQSATAELRVDGAYRLAPADGIDYGSLADALKEMGLFRGTTTGYDLMGNTTRAQGLVMFLRLMGKEDEALKCTAAVPFTDVSNHWAHPYVAYAYEQGLTTGVSATSFQPDAPVTAQHYLTFLMRALQYAEGTQFSYNTVLADAAENGLFTAEEISAMSGGTFLRHKMVYLSFYALLAEHAQSGELLLDTLIADGTVPDSAANKGLAAANGWRLG